jgi:hypothetical protein
MSEIRVAPELAALSGDRPIGSPRRGPLLPPPRPVRASPVRTMLPPPTRSTTRANGRTAPIRVSIRTSLRDPDLFVVRALPEGAAAPAGTREGTLLLASVQEVLDRDDETEEDDALAETDEARALARGTW